MTYAESTTAWNSERCKLRVTINLIGYLGSDGVERKILEGMHSTWEQSLLMVFQETRCDSFVCNRGSVQSDDKLC